MNRRLFAAGVVAALSMSVTTACLAQSPLARCFTSAAHRYHLSPVLLYSIAWGESRMNPRAMNRNSDGTIDIGMMQVNSRWLPMLGSFGISEDMLLDPCTNIGVGAWVLANEFYRRGASWGAVGRYNSPDPRVGAQYAAKVRAVFESMLPVAGQ